MSANWKDKLHVSPSHMEQLLADRLGQEGIRYLTQQPLYMSNCDFYFETRTRPLVVYIDGPPHLEMAQAKKDDVFRTAIRMSGYRVLELPYKSVSDKTVDLFLEMIRTELAKLG